MSLYIESAGLELVQKERNKKDTSVVFLNEDKFLPSRKQLLDGEKRPYVDELT